MVVYFDVNIRAEIEPTGGTPHRSRVWIGWSPSRSSSILLDFDANGLTCLQGGCLFFADIETATIMPVGHGYAGRRIKDERNVEARLVLLAPAFGSGLFRLTCQS